MTPSCRDDARRFLRPYMTPDGILCMWEVFIGRCPEWDLVVATLGHLAGFFDYHDQPLQAAKYREEAARLRNRLEKEVI
jgi:hypothetical protein